MKAFLVIWMVIVWILLAVGNCMLAIYFLVFILLLGK